MIPVKIQCDCGQKYAFDVEPVNGQLGSPVACPVCGGDGTVAANRIIAETLATETSARVSPPPLPRLRAVAASPPVASAATVVRPVIRPLSPAPAPAAAAEYSLGRGILGAVIGAAAGVGAMYGFFEWAGFRFPLLGVGIGVLTGFGARTLARGTDNALGYISGAIALVSVVATLYLIYGEFPLLSIISVAVSVSMAYRISSG